MSDITPGTVHFANIIGKSACGIEFTDEYDEDDDAEFIYTHDVNAVNCTECLYNLSAIANPQQSNN